MPMVSEAMAMAKGKGVASAAGITLISKAWAAVLRLIPFIWYLNLAAEMM